MEGRAKPELDSKDLKCATQFGESIKFLPQNTFTTAESLCMGPFDFFPAGRRKVNRRLMDLTHGTKAATALGREMDMLSGYAHMRRAKASTKEEYIVVFILLIFGTEHNTEFPQMCK